MLHLTPLTNTLMRLCPLSIAASRSNASDPIERWARDNVCITFRLVNNATGQATRSLGRVCPVYRAEEYTEDLTPAGRWDAFVG
jgi:hypothetical protein